MVFYYQRYKYIKSNRQQSYAINQRYKYVKAYRQQSYSIINDTNI